MDSSAEPKKKKRRHKKFAQKVDICIEKFSVLYFFQKYLVTLDQGRSQGGSTGGPGPQSKNQKNIQKNFMKIFDSLALLGHVIY